MSTQLLVAALLACLASAASAAAIDPQREAAQAFESARKALAQGDFQQAELFLERTLMYQAEHAEARVELALLLARRGRQEAALVLIESLVLDPRTPAAYRARLMALGRSLQGAATESASAGAVPDAWRIQADLAVGIQSNPLAGTSASRLLLTLPGGSLDLPIGDQVESAPVLRVSAQASHTSGLYLEAQAHSILGDVKRTGGRLLFANNIKDITQGTVSSGFTAEVSPLSDQSRGLFASWTGLKTRLSTQLYDAPSQAKRGLILRWDESIWTPKLGAVEASLTGFFEQEWALRQGPDQARIGARMLAKIGEKTKVWASLSVHRDQTGYSPFLENDARREMITLHTQAEQLVASLGQGGGLFIQPHFTRRWSGVSLFSFKDAGVVVALRQTW